MQHQTVVVLDFGGQYKELIARRVRECGVHSVILPGSKSAEDIKKLDPIGIILTGGPNSVYAEDAFLADPALFELGVPILGICYGQQLICHMLGGEVKTSDVKEYGVVSVELRPGCALFSGIEGKSAALMSHTDQVVALPEGFSATASSDICPIAGVQNEEKEIYGVQFHPEVEHTEAGRKLFENFLFDICGARGDYSIDSYIDEQVAAIREQVGAERVLLALSGGVDSSVCAALLSKAVPGQLTCIYVDHGMMRKNESAEIKETFSGYDLDFVMVDAEDRFLSALAGVTSPEQKRKIIGSEFIAVFEDEAKKIGDVKFLAQGTIYPDVVESGIGAADTIKSHHNVGGLPETMDFTGIVEPLRGLFKDEVRTVGRMLGLPDAIIDRQPFPGPGLGVRVIGELTKEKLDLLREADAVFRNEVAKLAQRPSQYFAVLTPLRSVGVMGDSRTYDYTIALRAVDTTDFMTASYTKLPHDVLERAASRIVNEIDGVNRVVYDITSKPPATIEWE